MSAREFGKITKYKDLEIEIERICHLKSKLIPVAVAALGTVNKGTKQYLKQIAGFQHSKYIDKYTAYLNQ